MHNLILSTEKKDITTIIPCFNYVTTDSKGYYNTVKVLNNNQIYYTTINNSVLNIDHTKFSGSTGNVLNIISNTNTDGQGLVTFDDNIYSVSGGSFYDLTSLTSVNIKKAIPNLNCNSMFYSCSNLSGVSLSNTSNVTDMGAMFVNCRNLSGVSLDTSNVTNMGSMFNYCSNLSGVSLSNTSKVTNMGNMFNSCSNLSGVSLDTSNVTGMGGMFTECISLSEVTLNTSKVTDMGCMFQYCNKLSGVTLNTSNVISMIGMFDACANLKTINITNFGKVSGLNGTVDFSKTIWGQTSSSDTTADATAVQSIRDTLITNSFDRKTAGYSVLTVKLESHTFHNFLTDAERIAITNKGYTLTAFN